MTADSMLYLKMNGGGPSSLIRNSLRSWSVAPCFIFTRMRKWFCDERFLKVSVPLLGMAAGRLLQLALFTAFNVAPCGMTAPVSTPTAVNPNHFAALVLAYVSSAM